MCGRKFSIKTVCMAAKQMVHLYFGRPKLVLIVPLDYTRPSCP